MHEEFVNHETKRRLGVEEECSGLTPGLFLVNMDLGFGFSEPAAIEGQSS